MTTAAQDQELLARVVEGDHEAFNQIMRHHEDRVFSVCLRIMGNREQALDATQETFLTAFRKADQFKGNSALGTWIYRIAVNTCYDQLRKQKRRRTDPIPGHLDPTDYSAQDEVDSAALRPEIVRALAALPQDFRSAIVLSDIEGMGLPEVADVLGVPVGTVKSRVFRGRRLLAQELGNQSV
ncbi:MAG TPA: sigma-70 family RNA polymerase sigma factor [Acidimicrobiia bacterium]|nr:sigma-70 family RNA polymerase sigma factor [Acidimicrobiia bacterium]